MIGLSASTAARKNCFTAASLYFCWVRTATSTSAAWRMARARSQLTSASESTSGASNSSNRGGMFALVRQKSRFSAESASGSSAAVHCSKENDLKSRRSDSGSSTPGGARQTGCFVPAASGLEALATSPARWLKMTDLPMFVPPTIPTTKSGAESTCGSSLLRSSSNHSRPSGPATPTSAATGSNWTSARWSRLISSANDW